jgi:probable rRNA maturation factor
MEFEIHNEELIAKTGYRADDIRLAMDIIESSMSKYKKAWKVIKDMTISVVFVTPEEVQNLNYEFRAKEDVTDVLSFTVSERIAEIYICPKYIKERLVEVSEKEVNRIDLVSEFIRLFIHGVLHVAGYDHKTYLEWCTAYEGKEEMFKLQEKILKDVLKKAKIVF